MSGSATLGRGALPVLCLVQVLVALEFSIVNVAVPDLIDALSIDPSSAQWLLSVYAITLGSGLVVGGLAADVLGPRRMLLAGLTVFAVASAAAAAASVLWLLVVMRAVQGFAAAVMTPAALSIITGRFHGPRRDRAIAWWGAGGSLGFALGSVLGGLLVGAFGWPSIFLACAAVAVLTAWGAVRWVPPVAAPHREARSWTGSLLLFVASSAGLTWLALTGAGVALTGPAPVTALAVAVLASGALWLGRGTSAASPVPMTFARRPMVWRGNAVSFALTLAGGSMVFFVSIYAQDVLHWRPATIGLALVPDAVAAAWGAHSAGPLIRRLGLRGAAATALVTVGAGLASLAAIPSDHAVAAAVVLVVGTCLVGFGLVLGAVVATTSAVTGLDAEEHGLGAGLITTTQQWGLAVGIAVLSGVAATDLPVFGHGPSGALRGGCAFAVLTLIGVVATRRHAATVPVGVSRDRSRP